MIASPTTGANSHDIHAPARKVTAFVSFFFFNDTATTEIYTLSLHDALPIRSISRDAKRRGASIRSRTPTWNARCASSRSSRSEEHTSELQSRENLVCRL